MIKDREMTHLHINLVNSCLMFSGDTKIRFKITGIKNLGIKK